MSNGIRKIALTGGIASGKSMVGDYLKQRGVPVIDADDVVHGLLKDDTDLKRQIRQEFGPDVFTSQGQVDRQALGKKVFGDPPRRKLLESWIHPKVRQVVERFFKDSALHKIGVAIIPLLFESNLEGYYDEVWLLETDEAQQVERLMKHRGMSRQDAMARIQSQMPLSEKRKRTMAHPTYQIIDNRGTPELTRRQVADILENHGLGNSTPA